MSVSNNKNGSVKRTGGEYEKCLSKIFKKFAPWSKSELLQILPKRGRCSLSLEFWLTQEGACLLWLRVDRVWNMHKIINSDTVVGRLDWTVSLPVDRIISVCCSIILNVIMNWLWLQFQFGPVNSFSFKDKNPKLSCWWSLIFKLN